MDPEDLIKAIIESSSNVGQPEGEVSSSYAAFIASCFKLSLLRNNEPFLDYSWE